MVMFLQGRRVVKAEELATHFEINVRTVYRDVSALSEAGVPVIGEAGVGYSLVKGYHLPPVMFTSEEAMALFVGGEMVKQFADASMTGPMESALLKIRSVLPRERQDDLDRLNRATAIYGAPRTPPELDHRTLLPIQQAIVSRCVLRLTYRGRGRDTATAREVEPLGVAFHRDSWYLVAWCRMREDYRSFKLGRLHALEVLSERFAARPDFSLREYMKESMKPEDTVPTRIWFSKDAWERAKRDAYTRITAERPSNEGVEAELQSHSLEWLARWLLAFGTEAEALEPPRLRELVRDELAAIARRYAPAFPKKRDHSAKRLALAT